MRVLLRAGATRGSVPGLLFWTLLLLTSSLPCNAVADEENEGATPLISKALEIIEPLYLHPEAIEPDRMLNAAVQRLEHLDPAILVTEQGNGLLEVSVAGRSARFDTAADSLEELEAGIAEVLDFVAVSEGTTEHISRDDLEKKALRGILQTIDRHSRLFAGDSLDDFNTRFKGTLVGIGARIGKRGGKMKVVQPFPEAPAGRGGLKAGDHITHVDGVSTAGLSLEETVDRIRGPKGLPVVLTIERSGEDAPRVFVLIREKVLVPSITSETLSDGIGLVSVERFSQKTSGEFSEHLEGLRAKGPLRGLVIDLRGNTGGSMRHASRIVNYFVSEGTIIRTEGAIGEPVPRLTPRIDAEPGRLRYEGPVAVLVDRRTASGAEIVAGALKFFGRSLTLGDQTFGKGTVQKVYPLRKSGEKVSMKLTVARYLLPEDTFINSVGVTPDVLLGTVLLDPDESVLPDQFREPPELIGELEARGGLDSRRNPGSGRAATRTGENSTPALQLRVARVLDTWDPAAAAPSDAAGTADGKANEALADEPGIALSTPGSSEVAGDVGEPLFNDMAMRLAHEVLVAARGKGNRRRLIQLAAPRVARWQAIQSQRLRASAALRDIEWSATEQPRWLARTPARAQEERKRLLSSRPTLQAELLLPPFLEAGEQTQVTLRVTNTSEQPVLRLRAKLRSSNSVIDHLGFLLGDVAPGGQVQRTVPVSVHAGAASRLDPWRLYLIDDDGPLGGPVQGTVSTRGGPRPELAVAVRSEAAVETSGSSRINATVMVRNQGEGPSGELRVRFGRPDAEGVERVEQYRTIEGLQPGEIGEVTLSLQVRDPAALPTLPIRMRARDRSTGVATVVELQLQTSGPGEDTGWRLPATMAMEFPYGRPSDPPGRVEGPFEIRGHVEAEAGIDWVEVLLDRDKVFSRVLPHAAGDESQPVQRLQVLATAIPELGPNRVSVRARTHDGVIVTSSYWVLGIRP